MMTKRLVSPTSCFYCLGQSCCWREPINLERCVSLAVRRRTRNFFARLYVLFNTRSHTWRTRKYIMFAFDGVPAIAMSWLVRLVRTFGTGPTIQTVTMSSTARIVNSSKIQHGSTSCSFGVVPRSFLPELCFGISSPSLILTEEQQTKTSSIPCTHRVHVLVPVVFSPKRTRMYSPLFVRM
jgi:hypothetical protein